MIINVNNCMARELHYAVQLNNLTHNSVKSIVVHPFIYFI